jgi:hypothetical protein
MKRLALLVLALLLSACGPTITENPDALRLIAEEGEVRLEAVAPMLWARVALKGEKIVSPYCELPDCAVEEGVIYLALPPEVGPYPLTQPVATYGGLQGGAAIATLENARESHTAQLEQH